MLRLRERRRPVERRAISPRASSDLVDEIVPGDPGRPLILEIVQSPVQLLLVSGRHGQDLGIAPQTLPELIEQFELFVAAQQMDVHCCLRHGAELFTRSNRLPLARFRSQQAR